MLTAYDTYTAAIFDDAGIPALLVGDYASDNLLVNGTSLPITVDELLPRCAPSPAPRAAPWCWPTCRLGPTRPRRSRPFIRGCAS